MLPSDDVFPPVNQLQRGTRTELVHIEGAKLLLVQPITLDDKPRGATLLAVDAVGAGVHEKVLVVIEGRAAAEAVGRKGAPVDAAIIVIVDTVDIQE